MSYVYKIGDFVASYTRGKKYLGFIKDKEYTSIGILYSIEYKWDEDGNEIKPFETSTFDEYIMSGFEYIHKRVKEKTQEIANLRSIEEHV